MDRLIYTAMVGAQQALLAQQSNANNIANVTTVGFKADLDFFKSLPVYGPGFPSRVVTEVQSAGIDFKGGSRQTTGRSLDVAVNGNGFMAVEAKDGTEAYTRRGDLHVNELGQLLNGIDQLVKGEGGAIALPPFDHILIGSDGTITIQPQGEGVNALVVVDRIKLVNPDLQNLTKREDGLLEAKDGRQLIADAAVTITSEVLETSNVNAVDSMVRMIENARFFESQVKLMKLAEENDAAASRLLRMN